MKSNNLSSIGGMFEGMMRRHGISRQILAANLLKRGEEELALLLPPEMLTDVRPLSFKEGLLILACRHHAALYDAEGLGSALGRKLEEHFPNISIRVEAKLKPEAFREDYS